MTEDPLKRWAKSELERLDREERREKSRIADQERALIIRERYINAPVINLEGKVIVRNTLSKGEKNKP